MPTAIELAKQFQASLVGEASLVFNGLAPLPDQGGSPIRPVAYL